MTTSQAAFAAVLMLGAAAPALAQSQTYQTAPPRGRQRQRPRRRRRRRPSPSAIQSQPRRADRDAAALGRRPGQRLAGGAGGAAGGGGGGARQRRQISDRPDPAAHRHRHQRPADAGARRRRDDLLGRRPAARDARALREPAPLRDRGRRYRQGGAGDGAARRAQSQRSEPLPRPAPVRVKRNDAPGALALYRQAIQLQTATGQPIPVEWRQQMCASPIGAPAGDGRPDARMAGGGAFAGAVARFAGDLRRVHRRRRAR